MPPSSHGPGAWYGEARGCLVDMLAEPGRPFGWFLFDNTLAKVWLFDLTVVKEVPVPIGATALVRGLDEGAAVLFVFDWEVTVAVYGDEALEAREGYALRWPRLEQVTARFSPGRLTLVVSDEHGGAVFTAARGESLSQGLRRSTLAGRATLSPDGRWCVVRTGALPFIFDLERPSAAHHVLRKPGARAFEFDPSGARMAVAASDVFNARTGLQPCTMTTFAVGTWAELDSWPVPGSVTDIAFDAGRERILVSLSGAPTRVYTSTGVECFALDQPRQRFVRWVGLAGVLNRDWWVASRSQRGELRVWSAFDGSCVESRATLRDANEAPELSDEQRQWAERLGSGRAQLRFEFSTRGNTYVFDGSGQCTKTMWASEVFDGAFHPSLRPNPEGPRSVAGELPQALVERVIDVLVGGAFPDRTPPRFLVMDERPITLKVTHPEGSAEASSSSQGAFSRLEDLLYRDIPMAFRRTT